MTKSRQEMNQKIIIPGGYSQAIYKSMSLVPVVAIASP